MTRAEAIDRAKKLLALAKGTSNEHEAALAAERAAKLLAAHSISPEMLDEAPEPVTRDIDAPLDIFDGTQWIGRRCYVWLEHDEGGRWRVRRRAKGKLMASSVNSPSGECVGCGDTTRHTCENCSCFCCTDCLSGPRAGDGSHITLQCPDCRED